METSINSRFILQITWKFWLKFVLKPDWLSSSDRESFVNHTEPVKLLLLTDGYKLSSISATSSFYIFLFFLKASEETEKTLRWFHLRCRPNNLDTKWTLFRAKEKSKNEWIIGPSSLNFHQCQRKTESRPEGGSFIWLSDEMKSAAVFCVLNQGVYGGHVGHLLKLQHWNTFITSLFSLTVQLNNAVDDKHAIHVP